MITNQKSTKLYLFNGVVLTVLWLLARVLLFVYYFIHMYFHYDQVCTLVYPCALAISLTQKMARGF
jgi:hypothetical protein